MDLVELMGCEKLLAVKEEADAAMITEKNLMDFMGLLKKIKFDI